MSQSTHVYPPVTSTLPLALSASPSRRRSCTRAPRPRTLLLGLLSLLLLWLLQRQFAERIDTQSRPLAMAASTQGSAAPTSAAPESVAAYLARTKPLALQHLSAAKPESSLMLVMGNTAGDLDSAASAIGLAYLLTHFPSTHPLSLPAGTVIVPLLHSEPADASLRPENTMAFERASLSLSAPLHVSELPAAASSEAFASSRNTFFGLVDHASLAPQWASSASGGAEVKAIVDHHVDESAHSSAPLRVFKGPGSADPPIGSAASIVADLYREAFEAGKVPTELVDLLLSAILIDTDDVRPCPNGKAAPLDVSSYKLLAPLSSIASSSASGLSAPSDTSEIKATPDAVAAAAPAVTAFWQQLVTAKLDVSRLSSRDLLRRDWKEFSVPLPASGESVPAAQQQQVVQVGFASVPQGLSTWLDRIEVSLGTTPASPGVKQPPAGRTAAWESFWTSLESWMREKSLDFCVVGTSFRETRSAESRSGSEEEERAEERAAKEDKHKRETIIAAQPHTLSASRLDAIWPSITAILEKPRFETGAEDTLLLQPWRGARSDGASGKREKVQGLTLLRDSKSQDVGKDARGVRASGLRVTLWRQGNARASRKVVLPLVLGAVKKALGV